MPDLSARTVRGWEVLRLADEALVLDVVPGLGGTVTALSRAADGAGVLWANPAGLPPRGAPLLPGGTAAQLADSHPGGWSSTFPDPDPAGAPWGQAGEARLTWLDWELAGEALVLTGRLRRFPVDLTRTITLDGPAVTVTETVRCRGGEPVEVVWASSLALGGDLVGPGTTVRASASTVHPEPASSPGTAYEDVMPWPRAHGQHGVVNLSRLPGPDAGETRVAYLTDLTATGLTVTRADRTLGLDLEWDPAWPHLWYALEAGGQRGHPWWSAGYVLALSPASSWPAAGVADVRRTSGTTLGLAPGEETSRWVRLRLHAA